jgi:hypothetical protein
MEGYYHGKKECNQTTEKRGYKEKKTKPQEEATGRTRA